MRRTVISEEFTDDIVRALGRGPRSSVLRQLRQLRQLRGNRPPIARGGSRLFARLTSRISHLLNFPRKCNSVLRSFQIATNVLSKFLGLKSHFFGVTFHSQIFMKIPPKWNEISLFKRVKLFSPRLDLFFNFKKSGFSRREDVL